MATRKIRSPRLSSSSKHKSAKSAKISDALVRVKALEKQMSHVIRDMQEKVRQLEYLNDFSSWLNSSLDTEMVAEKALEATCQLLRCETAALLFVDHQKGDLFWESTLESPGGEIKKSGIRLPIDNRSVAGTVVMTGESRISNNLDENHSKITEDLGFSVKTTICVPLKAKGGVMGVLQAFNKLPSIPARASQNKWPDFYDEDKRLLENLSHQVAIALENAQLYTDIKRNFFDTVEALAEAIEKKDHYTGGHTRRVVYYSMCIAKYMDLSPETLEKVRLCAILHDIGKIGIEDKILKKEAPLDPQEWKIMQTHPDLGYDILARVEGLKDVIGGMRSHHERWDGRGYPDRLKGEEIPLVARVIAVSDTFDAMVSTRPYRKGMDPLDAYQEILRHKGTQFDPSVVDAFEKAFKNEKMGKGSGGSSHPVEGPSTLSNCD